MKRVILLSIGFMLLLWACEEKFESGDFIPSDVKYTDSINIPPLTEIGKRGIYLRPIGSDWSAKVSSTQAHWHYSEAAKRSIKEPGNIDFVPMISDSGDLDVELYDYLFELKDEGLLLNLLTFKEPDDSTSLLSVDDAINAWPELEQFDVPLGSPLCADISGTWINDFMAQSESSGLRVDYIVMQWYGAADATAFLKTVDSVYNAFGKPVWIAKFAPVNARLSEVKTFIETVIPELESRDHVYRYAWDPGALNTPTAFWDAEDNLTPRGEYYAGYQPNNFVSFGRDDWLDVSTLENMVLNGDVETGTLDYWGGWGTSVVEGDLAYEGNYAASADKLGWNDGTSLNYKSIIVESEATYYISFAAKNRTILPSDLDGVRMLMRDNNNSDNKFFRSDFITSTEWQVFSYQVYIPEGVTDIRLIWYRYSKHLPPVIVDNLFVAKIE